MFKRTLIASSLSLLLMGGVAHAETDLTSPVDQKSYALGMVFGQQILANIDKGEFEINKEAMIEALSAVLSGEETLMNGQQLQTFLQGEQEKHMAEAKQKSEASMKEGQLFIDEYAKKEGVMKTDNGIYYQVMATGAGKQPLVTDTVKVHYAGTLQDGTEFDSSYTRGIPAEFPVNGVIQGWQEILPMMKEGDKWEVAIPADLAYGARGSGASIGPNEPLVFTIELLEVK